MNRWVKTLLILIIGVSTIFSWSSKIPQIFAQTPSPAPTPTATTSNGSYFLMPLIMTDESIASNSDNPARDQLIYNLVMDQGYQTHCAGNFHISKEIQDDIDHYFNHNPGSITVSNGSEKSKEEADLSAAKIPMYRGSESPDQTTQLSSLEGYFGAVNIQNPDPELNTGVINKLLSTEKQCENKIHNLAATIQLCQMMSDPSQCVLNQPMANTNNNGELFTPETLLNAYRSEIAGKFSCNDLVSGWREEYSAKGINQDRFVDIIDAIKYLSVNQYRIYRTAYLVIAPQQNVNGDGDRFWFLNEEAPNQTKHAPIFISFKIPDFATNEIMSLSRDDAGSLTAYALQDISSRNDFLIQEQDRRKAFITAILNKQDIRKDNDEEEMQRELIINCNGMPTCTGNTPDLPNYVREALVDIINGANNSCDAAKPENARELGGAISTGTGLSQTDLKIYKAEYQGGVIAQAQNLDFNWELKMNDADDARRQLQDPNGQPEVMVEAHLIAPVGTNMERLANGLQGIIPDIDELTETNILYDSNLKQGDLPNYYQIVNADVGYSSKAKISYYDPDPCGGETEPAPTGGPSPAPDNCHQKDFTIYLRDKAHNKGVYILGAKVGWLVQHIQETLREEDTEAYEYINSCQRAEDMLTGKCPGKVKEGESQPTPTP